MLKKEVLYTISFTLFLITGALTGADMNTSQKIKENTPDGEKYIILHTHGNVRNAETVVVAEVVAPNAAEAIKMVMPEIVKIFVFNPDYQHNANFALLENPASFVSDIIDNYSAQRGHLLVNDNKELHFLVEYLTRKSIHGERTIHHSKKIWARDAETLLKKQLRGKYKKWQVSAEGRYYAKATKVPDPDKDPAIEYIVVSAIYELDQRK